jgi:arylsulfatase A-like enzyme
MKKIEVCLLALSFLFISLATFSQQKQPHEKKPNILFLIADDAGTDFSAYGSTFVNTPGFDAVAQEGLLFKNAFTPNAKCAPSRASIITGRNSWQLEAAANHIIYFPVEYKTWMEVLGENGYATGYTGKGYAPGKALDEEGRPRFLLGKEYASHFTDPPTTGISKKDYAANFGDFFQEQKITPWAFWVGFQEPHRAYEYGTGARLAHKNTGMIKKVPGYFPDVDTVRNDLLDYAYEIEYLDSQVQRIVNMLREAGELDNTIIIYTSDHGMPFPRVKGNQYNNANHVPLAISWRNGIKNPGRKIEDLVSFIDFAPTLLQAAGIEPATSGMHPITGNSLFPIFNSANDGQVEASGNFVLVGQERHDVGRPNDEGYPIRGMYKNYMLYLKNYEPDRWPVCNPETGYLNCDGSPTKSFILNQRRNGKTKYFWKMDFGHRPAEELYDLRKDPDCICNLADSSQYKNLALQLKSEMEKKLKEQGDLRMFGYGTIYEKYPVTEMNGFYERYMKGEKFDLQWVNKGDFENGEIEDY